MTHLNLPFLRQSIVAAAAALAAAMLMPVAAAESVDTPALRTLDIAAGPLAEVLGRYAASLGLALSFSAEQVGDRRSDGLHGRYSADEGFRMLLNGTGLVHKIEGNVVTLHPAPAGAVQLPAVRVESTVSSNNAAVSEGTQSYTGRAATVFKGAQSLREIPQSVSVVTRQRMDDQNLVSVAEALRSTTGVTVSGYQGTESYSARGYAMSNQFDGVPQQSDALHLDLAIYDRIEVLRGPSGLVQGSGEPGGTVNYVRKRAGDRLALSGALSLGSWDNYRGELDVGGPLNKSGSLRARGVAVFQDQDFFYDVANSQRQTLYGTVEYDLTQATTAGIALTRMRRDANVFWGLPMYSDGTRIEDRSSFVGAAENYNMDVDEISADIRHRFGSGWEAKIAAFYQERMYDGFGSYATAPLSRESSIGTLAVGHIQGDMEREGVDVNLSGPVEMFGRTHTLTVGYNRATYDYTVGSLYVRINDVDVLNQHYFGDALPGDIPTKSQTVTHQSGFYGLARIKLLDPLTLIVGARFTDYSSKSRPALPEPGPWTRSKAAADNEFSPYGGLVWDVTSQVSLYASYADIFVPQTQMNVREEVLDPRVGWQGEVGAKGEWFDGALNASIAVFRIRDTNRAMRDLDNVGCGGTADGACFVAAGLTQSEGWEAEVSGSPTSGWDVTAGYTYNTTEILRDTNSASVGMPVTTLVPKHLFKLWNHYRFGKQTFGGALDGWSAGLGVQAQSEIYSGVATTEVQRLEQPGYALTSLSLAYQSAERWSATLAVNNLCDRHYFNSLGNASFANLYGEPVNVMLTVRARW